MTNKTLKDFMEVYRPKSKDEQKFVDKHVVVKHKDRNEVNGTPNGDDVFQATNIKAVDRVKQNKGYNPGDDEKVYEEAEQIDEISAETKDVYAKKAVKQLPGLFNKSGKDADAARKYYNRKNTVRKIANEEVEDLDEAMPTAQPTLRGTLGQKVAGDQAAQLVRTVGSSYAQQAIRKAVQGAKPMPTSTAQAATFSKEDIDESSDAYGQSIDAEKKKNISADDKSKISKLSDMMKAEKKPVSEAAFDAESKAHDRHYDKQTERVKNMLDKYAIQGMTYKQAHAKISKPTHILHKEITPLHEEVEGLDESAKIAAHLVKRYGDNVRKSHVLSAAKDFGVEPSKLAKAVRKKLGKNTLDEEQLDELSRKTLGAYGSKALRAGLSDDEKSEKRMKGANLASAKMYPSQYTKSPLKAKVNATEEVEQIDELSSKKLMDYSAKAADARAYKDLPTAKIDNRLHGMDLARKKIANVHAKVAATNEDIDPDLEKELKATRQTSKSVADARIKLTKGWGDGGMSMKSSYGKITKEEFEQIDELSKNTLGKYAYKAASQIGEKGITAGLKIQNDERADKEFKTMGKRQKGIATAVKKLTKEDIINRTIQKYMPEEITTTREERLIKKLDGINESHVYVLLDLFNSLNEDNQVKMLETVDTREGIIGLIDFALENRG